jgi:glycerophosphoryl diester phosphodiesterase
VSFLLRLPCPSACLRLLLAGAALAGTAASASAFDRGAAIAAEIAEGRSGQVLVVAHRADWRSHPENSLPAIRSAIALGVDVVEVDVRRTKDGRFVIIHDTTLDRTTTGRGRVADHTLAELRDLRLRDGAGSPTDERIPTLEEALNEVRGRAVVNLDKSSEHPAEIFAIVEREQALGFALFSVTQPLAEFERTYPGLIEKMPLFMLVVGDSAESRDALIGPYLERRPPAVLQLVFAREDRPALAWVERARGAGIRVWFNALWPHHNAGHHDDRALTDPEGAYGWLVARGATLIQTDRPGLLLEFLRRAERRR